MSSVTLLLIDDDALDRKAVAMALRALGMGYALQEAHDGQQGVELAVAGTFDCILLDYNIPDMNGLDILAELRKRLSNATPIVMLTGSGSEFIAVEAMKRGASDYLPKDSLAPESLFRVVSNAIEKHSLQKKTRRSSRKIGASRAL